MKFRCQQQKLSKALNIVSRAVTSRTTIPVLKGILLEVNNGKLTMSASDLDIAIKNTIDVEVVEEGSVVITAKLFGDIIRKLPSSEIEIKSDENNNIVIDCLTSEFKVVGMSTDKFPIFNTKIDVTNSITFDKKSLKTMIEKTAFAASLDEARGIITGVLIELNEDEMTMVAIDGYRMAITKKDYTTINPKKIVISVKTLNEISKILNDIDEEENVNLYLNERKAIFEMGNCKAELKIMEGEFIKYKDILPKDNKIEVIINRSMFLNSIERASLLSKAGKNNLIRMNISENVITITSNSEEGNVKEDIIVTKNGENLVIGFNAQYVIDVLKNIDDDEVKMLLNTPITPCLIEPLEGNEYKYLVLPVRIN